MWELNAPGYELLTQPNEPSLPRKQKDTTIRQNCESF